jgi:hypothetical protein
VPEPALAAVEREPESEPPPDEPDEPDDRQLGLF